MKKQISKLIGKYKEYKRESAISKIASSNKNKYDFEKALVISGEPRGGTTWLAELLLKTGTSSLLWEPLHPDLLRKSNSDMKEWSLKNGKLPHVPKGTEDEKLKAYLLSLFDGTRLSHDLLYHNPQQNWSNNKEWLVKFCRANLILPWLTETFEFEHPPIYLIRHPLAVVSSQMRHKSFDHFGDVFTLPKAEHTDYFNHFKAVVKKVNSKEEYHAAFWSLNNALPLNEPNKKYITISYEYLVSDAKSEIELIEKAWKMDLFSKMEGALKKPSHSTKSGSNILTGSNQLITYKKYLSDNKQKEIMAIVKDFGIDTYSINETHPNLER